MLKLLVVDDEYLVTDYVITLIQRNFKDIDIVGTASTGREAIEKAISLKPDIVFMDINMPGIDGIEAIKQIKETNNDIFFVILTAYEYFDYAKEALNLGVFEYLLKPINKAKLIDTINNLKVAIDKKRKSLMLEVELKERINRIIPFLEGQFIYYKMFNIGTVNDVEFYQNVFNINLKQGYVMNILLENLEKDKDLEYKKQKFYELFKAKLKGITSCLVGNLLTDRIVVFIPTDTEDVEFIKYQSIEIAKKIYKKIGDIDLKYKIGIGRNYNIDNFNKSCNEAYIAASLNNGQTIIHYGDITNNNIKHEYPWHLETSFLNCIVCGDFNQAKEIFKTMYILITNFYNDDLNKIKSKLIELAFSIDRIIPYKLENLSSLKHEFILNLLKLEVINDMGIEFLKYISDIMYNIQNQRKEHIDDIISKVLDFINKHYNQDISLYDAAKSVNLSYHYLSKIFKSEIGKGFSDYLTELRIEKSIELLVNQRLSIKEICQQIGYNDPNYYCKAFKKIIGMTPTEYRALKNIRGDYIG